MAVKKANNDKDSNVGSQEEKDQVVSNVFSEENAVITEEVKGGVSEAVVEVKAGISEEELEVILAREREKMQTEFQKIMREEFQKNEALSAGKKEIASDLKRGEDLIDDWLETPVTFFSYSFTYSLFSDMRQGKESIPPNGMIKFKTLIRRIVKSDRGVTTTSVCVAKSNSRAEVEWLRSSPLFGITFQESISGTTTMDASMAQVLIASNQEVNKLNDYDVITKCRAYNLPILTDVQVMRKNLTQHLADMKKAASDKYYANQMQQMANMTENESGKLERLIER